MLLLFHTSFFLGSGGMGKRCHNVAADASSVMLESLGGDERVRTKSQAYASQSADESMLG